MEKRMAEKEYPIEQILAILTETPSRLAALTAGLEPDALTARPGEDTWCINEILAHLRSCSDVWGDCIRTILAEDHPRIRAINPRTWIERTDYRALPFLPSLRAFTQQRAELLDVLQPLPPLAWQRSATVWGAGNNLERTVRYYADGLARHERSHFREIGRIADLMRM
jgi:hypothetical protein